MELRKMNAGFGLAAAALLLGHAVSLAAGCYLGAVFLRWQMCCHGH